MSASTIARWNAIPMTRPDHAPDPDSAPDPVLKTSVHNDEDSEDNVSLVSRSPSPPAPMELDKYDEYVRGDVREVVTVDTKIKSSNRGFAMLAKLGWVEGQPLGLSGEGRIDPVRFVMKNDSTGLGKTSQDVRMIESTVSQRRELDSERQTKETEDQRRAREESVAKRASIQTEISTILKAFYCELCEKQFQTVAQYDEHTNSYAHHHKARFRDMQAVQRQALSGGKEEMDKRKEKEKKREEKELRKMAKAMGVKMTKPATTIMGTGVGPAAMPTPNQESTSGDEQSKPSAFKKSGWATVGSASASTPAESTRSVEPSSASTLSGGWKNISQPPPPSNLPSVSTSTNPGLSSAPAFRTGGWTSLDTGSTISRPSSQLPAPTAASSVAKGNWATVASPAQPSPLPSAQPPPPPQTRGGWSAIPSSQPPPPPTLPPTASQPRGGWSSAPTPPQLPSHSQPPLPHGGAGEGWSAISPSPNLGSTSPSTHGEWNSISLQPHAPNSKFSTGSSFDNTPTPIPGVSLAPRADAQQQTLLPSVHHEQRKEKPRQEVSRSGWQQFKAGGGRRR